MKGTSLARMAWRNLWRNRRRTLLTLSSIVFGIFLSVIMAAMQDRNWEDMIRLAARLPITDAASPPPALSRERP